MSAMVSGGLRGGSEESSYRKSDEWIKGRLKARVERVGAGCVTACIEEPFHTNHASDNFALPTSGLSRLWQSNEANSPECSKVSVTLSRTCVECGELSTALSVLCFFLRLFSALT